MGKIAGFLKRRWFLLSWLLAFATILSVAGVQLAPDRSPAKAQFTLGRGGEAVITLGSVAEAAGAVDYTFDGVNDNVEFQAALNALPAGGGRLVVVSATQINFAALTTVTRAIANVTIEGTGRGTYFVGDGVTALFTAGGNNWKFTNIRTDAAGLAMAATTGWEWNNVTVNATYYAYRTDDATTGASWNIPTGRGATLVVAANDSSTAGKAQADYLCDGADDDVQINAAIDAVELAGFGTVLLLPGTYNTTADIDFVYAGGIVNIELSGYGAIISRAGAGNGIHVDGTGSDAAWVESESFFAPYRLTIEGVEITGTAAGTAGLKIENITTSVFRDVWVRGFSTGSGVLFAAAGGLHVEGHKFYNLRTTGNLYGMNIPVSIDSVDVFGALFSQTVASSYGIYFTGAGAPGTTFSGITCWLAANNTVGVYLNNTASGMTFTSLKVESNAKPGTVGIQSGANYADDALFLNTITSALATDWDEALAPITKRNTVATTSAQEGLSTSVLALQYYNPTNLVANGSFETGDPPNTWATVNCVISQEEPPLGAGLPATATDGTKVLKILSNGNWANATYTLNTYTRYLGRYVSLSGWYFIPAADNRDHTIQVYDGIGGYPIYLSINTRAVWTYFSATGLIPAGATMIRVEGYANHSGDADVDDSLYLDSVMLVEGRSPTAYGTKPLTNEGNTQSGETRFASGTLTAGIANAIAFAWHNPEAQDILIKKVVVEITTGSVSANSVIDVGIADDAAGTNRGVEFFDDLDANDVDVNDSWLAGDGGTQTKWVLAQDSVSATDGWVVGQILVADAAALVGRYYIEYVGR